MSEITLTIPAWAVWTLLSGFVYYLLWSKADSCVYATVCCDVRLHDVGTVFRENIGMALRRIRRRPTYSLEMNPQLVFSFDAPYANPREVHMACGRIVSQVRRERWTYPKSQRNCVELLVSQLVAQARESGEKPRTVTETQVKMRPVSA
jgi:hypothetical protein